MAPLRARIDRIDDRIVAPLASRFALTRQVGEIRAVIGEAPMDPARQLQRQQWLSDIAARHQLDAALVARVFDTIRSLTVAEHERIAKDPDPAGR